MQKNIINILIIIGLFIGFYFLFSWLYQEDNRSMWTFRPEKKVLTYEEQQVEKEKNSVNDANLYNEAIKNKNTETCASITDTTEKTRCLDMVGATLALDALDREKCSTLSSSGMISLCQDNIAYRTASEKNDKSLCASISLENIRNNCLEEREQVLLQSLTSSGTVSLETCGTFETSTWKEKCNSLVVVKDDSAGYKSAIEARDLSACDAISDEKLRLQCRDTILFQSAVAKSDIALCDGISESTKMDACRASLEGKLDAESFQSFVTSGTLADCETLRTEAYRTQCHDMVLIRTVRTSGDTKQCKDLYATGMIDRCEKTGGK